MKTKIERRSKNSINSKIPVVIIDPELENEKGKVYFPEKLAKANEMLKTANLSPDMNVN